MSILVIFVLVIVGYIVLCALTYLIQEYFIFHPEKLPLDFKYQYEYPFEEVNFNVEPGARINGLHFRIPNSKGVIFYFKGNTRSVKGWAKFARDFVSKGYDFFMIDYRGFGKSRGKRTEKKIYQDCQVAYNYLKEQYLERKITIYGRSIGSGFATYIASKNTPHMLILDSPYLSFLHIAQRYVPFLPLSWILKYHIPTDEFIKEVECPIYIIHGTKDRLIPYRHAIKLASINKQNSHLIGITNGGHNNLPKFLDYHLVLYDILHGHFKELSLYEEVF